MSPSDHHAVVDLALQMGLIRQQDAEAARQTAGEDQSPLDVLVQAGNLTPKMVQALTQKLQSQTPLPPESNDDTWPQADPYATNTGSDETTEPYAGRLNPLLDAISDLDKTLVESDTADHYGFPQNWKNYQFRAFLGEGGMGKVYLAFDPKLERLVAVKFMRGDDPTLSERFALEAKAQAGVDHERICKVYEVDQIEGRSYIAMQYIDGQTLKSAAQHMTMPQKVNVIRQIAEGLHAAHRAGLIHRDIKPGNIMIEKTAESRIRPYIMDFGLAKGESAPGLTTTGMIVGTAYYMAPEQARCDVANMDARTDVYSLGATLYEILTGEPPFSGASSIEVIVQVLDEDPPTARSKNPAIPTDLDTIVMKCLEKDPSRRYESARALADDLTRFQEGDPITARPAGTLYRLSKLVRKNKPLVAVVFAAVLAVLTVAGWGVYAKLEAEKQAKLARVLDQEITEIENYVRYTYLVPLDDIRAQRQELQLRLAAMERKVADWGDIAVGPGHYAEGRVLLLLGSVDQAYQSLQAAWDSGYKEPKVAYALGIALGQRYEQALSDLDNIRERNLQEARRGEIETELRDPALDYLRQGREVELETPEYGEALIALYEGRFEEALILADTSYKQRPWLYEAEWLKAKIHIGISRKQIDNGKYQSAMTELKHANRALMRASNVARSNPWIQVDLALIASKMIQVEEFGLGGDIQSHFQFGLDACDRALTIFPECAEAFGYKTELLSSTASSLLIRGIDAREILEEAIICADQLLMLAPNSHEALIRAGAAYRRKGKYESKKNLDPTKSFLKAESIYKNALGIRINYQAYNALLIINKDLATQALNDGGNPAPYWKRAEEYYHKATKLRNYAMGAYNNIGNLYLEKGNYLHQAGYQADEIYNKAIASYQKALEINPNSFTILLNSGIAYSTLAENAQTLGKDPTNHINHALSFFKKAQIGKPVHPSIQRGIGEAYQTLARYKYCTNDDPVPILQESTKAFTKALEYNSTNAFAHLSLGINQLLIADYQVSIDQNPTQAIANSILELEISLKIEPNNTRTLTLMGLAKIKQMCITKSKKALSQKLKDFTTLFENIKELDPNNEDAHLHLATAHMYIAADLFFSDQASSRHLQLAHQYLSSINSRNLKNTKWHLTYSSLCLLWANWQELHHQNNNTNLDLVSKELRLASSTYPNHPELEPLFSWLDCLLAKDTTQDSNNTSKSKKPSKKILRPLIIRNSNIANNCFSDIKENNP